MSRNISTLSGREGRELDDSLWERLQRAAAKNNGSPSDKAFTEVADDFLIGEAMTGPDDGISRHRHMIVADVHVWRKEPGLVGAKQVVGAIRDALNDGPLSVAGYHVADLRIASTRFLRDPGGLHSHAVLSLECRLVETA